MLAAIAAYGTANLARLSTLSFISSRLWILTLRNSTLLVATKVGCGQRCSAIWRKWLLFARQPKEKIADHNPAVHPDCDKAQAGGFTASRSFSAANTSHLVVVGRLRFSAENLTLVGLTVGVVRRMAPQLPAAGLGEIVLRFAPIRIEKERASRGSLHNPSVPIEQTWRAVPAALTAAGSTYCHSPPRQRDCGSRAP